MNVDGFIKLMMMTTSSYDNEALVAIRKANAILASANLTWEEFVLGLQKMPSQAPGEVQRSEYWRGQYENARRAQEAAVRAAEEATRRAQAAAAKTKGPHQFDAQEMQRLFKAAYARIRPGNRFIQYIDSLNEWWQDKGFLTWDQYKALRNAAGDPLP